MSIALPSLRSALYASSDYPEVRLQECSGKPSSTGLSVVTVKTNPWCFPEGAVGFGHRYGSHVRAYAYGLGYLHGIEEAC